MVPRSSRSPRRLSNRQLVLAAADNHRSWFAAQARASQGHVYQHGTSTWTHPGDQGGDGHVAFPDLAAPLANEVLDALLRDYRQAKPLVSVLCWAVAPSRDLDIRLVARGFEKSWQPRWLGSELTTAALDSQLPPSVTLELAETLPSSAWPEPPRLSHHPPSSIGPQPEGRCSWHYAAVRAGRVIGQSKLHLTGGASGVAGLYDVEVEPAFQRQGVGRALTTLALREAREHGYRYAVLNSTPVGEPLYRQLGFRSLGWGQTWFLRREVLLAPPATTLQVQLAEAIARGDLATLTDLETHLTPTLLASSLPCGATPFELAVRFSKTRVARWLAAHGAFVDVVSAWDLGWHSKVTRLLRDHPERAGFQSGFQQTTPLHTAAERNDLDLATAVLAARPELTATDAVFCATPLAWAEHLGHHELAQLLKHHGASL